MENEWHAVDKVRPLLNKEVSIVDKEGNVLETGVVQLVSGYLHIVGSAKDICIAYNDICGIEVEGNVITVLDTGDIGEMFDPWVYEPDLEEE